MSLLGAPMGQVVVNGSAQTLVEGEVGAQVLLGSIIFSNTTDVKQWVTLYFDAAGLTFDETTSILWRKIIRPRQFKDYHFAITLDGVSNIVAVRGSGGVTASAFGARRTLV